MIEITEPYALWQQDGQISVVAADGTVIDTMRDGRFPDLPFVVGEGANTHLPDYLALLTKAGDLRSKIPRVFLSANGAGASSTTSGVEVMLPEQNPDAALAALDSLERMRASSKRMWSRSICASRTASSRASPKKPPRQRADALGSKRTRGKPGQT